MFSEIFNSEFTYIDIWFTDQNSKPLEIGDKIHITLVINWCVTYKKMTNYSIKPTHRIFVKGYGFLFFAENMGKNVSIKYGQKFINHVKQSYTFETASKRAI